MGASARMAILFRKTPTAADRAVTDGNSFKIGSVGCYDWMSYSRRWRLFHPHSLSGEPDEVVTPARSGPRPLGPSRLGCGGEPQFSLIDPPHVTFGRPPQMARRWPPEIRAQAPAADAALRQNSRAARIIKVTVSNRCREVAQCVARLHWRGSSCSQSLVRLILPLAN